ncbi:LuxQ periplasmic sensor domain-containing protein [Oceanimonas smirnovii]|uniref:LuxQ periplasmic sensor domain-containing protein n=1 Tax=Oceanimonas smirnovii TaxID=264574 RepID=UPI003FCFA5F2
MPSVTLNKKPVTPLLRVLLGALLPAFMLLAAALLLLTYRSTSTMVNNSIQQQLESASARLQILMSSYLNSLDGVLSATAEQPEIAQALKTDNTQLAQKRLQDTLYHRNGELLDLLMISKGGQHWINMSSPLYITRHRLHQLITSPPLYNQWISAELKAPLNTLFTLTQRYPVISPDSGRVIGSLLGGIVLNDNLTLLRQLGQGAENLSIQLILNNKPAGYAYVNNNNIETDIITKILSLQQSYGQYQGHYFSLQPIEINGEVNELKLLLVTDNTIAQQLQKAYGHHTLLALMLVLVTALLLSLYTLRLISLPLADLTRFAEKIRRGQHATFTPDRIQEFNFLGNSLENMVSALQQKEQRLTHLFDAANSAAIIIGNNNEIQAINHAAAALFKRSREQLAGTMLSHYFTPEQLAPLLQAIHQARKGNKVDGVETRMGSQPHRPSYQLWTLAPVFNNGLVTAVQLQGQDITRIKQVEASLQLNNLVMANMLEAVMIFDQQRRLVYANPAYHHITGYTLDDKLGQPPHLALPLAATKSVDPWQHIDEQGHWQGEIKCELTPGHISAIWLSIRGLNNEHGNISHYVVVFSER